MSEIGNFSIFILFWLWFAFVFGLGLGFEYRSVLFCSSLVSLLHSAYFHFGLLFLDKLKLEYKTEPECWLNLFTFSFSFFPLFVLLLFVSQPASQPNGPCQCLADLKLNSAVLLLRFLLGLFWLNENEIELDWAPSNFSIIITTTIITITTGTTTSTSDLVLQVTKH